MEKSETSQDLVGKLLIAMPSMGDPRFARSVIFVCEHGDGGTMGLVVNRPLADPGFNDLLGQLGIAAGPSVPSMPVHSGGPVDTGRGFVLHSTDYAADTGTLDVGGGFAMTATRDVLEALAEGRGPERSILALGYAGWAEGQLADEIMQNGWLTCRADAEVVFAAPDAGKWSAALALLGVDPLNLSATAGRA